MIRKSRCRKARKVRRRKPAFSGALPVTLAIFAPLCPAHTAATDSIIRRRLRVPANSAANRIAQQLPLNASAAPEPSPPTLPAGPPAPPVVPLAGTSTPRSLHPLPSCAGRHGPTPHHAHQPPAPPRAPAPSYLADPATTPAVAPQTAPPRLPQTLPKSYRHPGSPTIPQKHSSARPKAQPSSLAVSPRHTSAAEVPRKTQHTAHAD